ncbi:MAG: hypothetical protein LIP10_05095 [Clostridiales bacterium]|nr:hypothetical protein [Clostridiales bacterium]
MKKGVLKEALYLAVATALLTIILVVTMDLTNVNLQSPFEYNGDVVGVLSEIKNLTLGNGLYFNPNLAAPFGSNQSLTVKCNLLHYVFIRIIALFTNDAALILNSFYLLTFFLVMWASYIAFRCIGIKQWIATVISIIYSCLPYHFFRYEQHIFLAAYYTIPMVCISLYWFWKGELCKTKQTQVDRKRIGQENSYFEKKKLCISLVSVFLLGLADLYYSAFYMIILLFSMIILTLDKHDIKYVILSIFHYCALFVGLLICLLPLIFNYFKYESGDSRLGERTLDELSYYSLNIIQMLLPNQNHRISFLRSIRSEFDSYFQVTENSMSSLGIILAIGLIICFVNLFALNRNNKLSIDMKGISRINVFLILLSVNGGFSFFIGLFLTASIRCYNRTIVYIAFFSAMAIALYVQSGWNNISKRIRKQGLEKVLRTVVACVLILICVVDQIPKDVATGSYYSPEQGSYLTTIEDVESDYYRDLSFVQKIESFYEDDTKIFQYPIVTNYNSNQWPNNETGAYNSMRPYLHSTGKTSWSYGASVGDKTDYWLRMLQEEDLQEQLRVMVVFGFEGIYIDSDGYEDDELENLLQSIVKITGTSYISTEDNALYFFDIQEYAKMLRKELEENGELEIIKNRYMVYFEMSDGFYGTETSEEDTWNWSVNDSEILIYNLYDEEITITINFEMKALLDDEQDINLTINGENFVYTVSSVRQSYELSITLKSGINYLNFSSNIPNTVLETDSRELCFCVFNFGIGSASYESGN